ncbi:MAG: DUF2065 domain-containing protein [Pseudomonadota bacterium]
MAFFLSVMGMVLIVEGLPYFVFPDRMKAMLHFMLNLPDETLRRIGGAMMVLGLGLAYIGSHLL